MPPGSPKVPQATWPGSPRREARRGDPRVLWPEVRSIIVLGMNYGPEGDPLAVLAEKSAAAISVYARNRDYHDLVKGRLKMLASWLVGEAGPAAVKVFVDTAPVMEKPLAERAGLGWQGKHTNLVSRRFGSWLFLGSIFTSLELAPDRAGSRIIAAPAAPVSTPARRRPFRRPIVSMRAAAFPI